MYSMGSAGEEESLAPAPSTQLFGKKIKFEEEKEIYQIRVYHDDKM
jgi:hypothetical protein